MRRKLVIGIGLVLSLVVIDQWTKYLTLRDLSFAYDGKESFSERLGVFLGGSPPLGFDGYHFRPTRPVELSENFFRLRYAENPGAAFGMFRTMPANLRGPMFHVISIGAIFLIAFYFSKLSGSDPVEKWALFGLPTVLAGTIGNYIDRIARGFVIDFLEAHWKNGPSWPAFNVADAAICVGVGMLVIDAFVRREKKDAPVDAELKKSQP